MTADGKRAWVVRVERKDAPGVYDVHCDCKASVERSGALLIIEQTKHQSVAGYGRDAWSQFTVERE